ncbi:MULTISPECIES: glycosyl hydrolase family 28-related protein [Halocynthiibacter]|uniref:Right-handed parallel beta-helix repeat-containing protein n=1 Tax=Halocynthiibacter halioticoli TaxID=2986804 RepID=A0AAE3LPM0_9RHOB|nr:MULTISPECIES: glycosyl hydrolase family 28-related protein [Halocynthiibacter]MCV6823572.1 right-handed parallel beta-helix repeat-containing protein [Halocynthiibacter halioticoli]MCW4056573.1 glycosyl hydrolase family 28-related protein [Halocynthiibacter sp. SDUM655004]
MNKAITEGLLLMPPAFSNGLDQWSSQDGTVGSDTYDGAVNAAFVAADQDFGGCLELLKSETTQKLRAMVQTPLHPGCYLQIKARVKAISGNLPNVEIAGWAGGAGDVHVLDVVEAGPSVALTSYGEVVEVSAIVGTGARNGVDMPWGQDALYGHFGLNLTGANGGVVRIDDIQITDVTNVFLRDMMDWVDVRDYGAIGDGVTDNAAAFNAADAAANGRQVLVPEGVYALASNVTFESPVRFQGQVTAPKEVRLSLTKNFDFGSYVDAFGGDEVLALEKAIQALFNFTDHESLDLQGRRIELTRPIDVQDVVNNISTYAIRRVIRNGQFNVLADPAWDTDVVTSTASYSASTSTELTNVANIANIQPGSLVEGNGVGREVYVKSVNVGAQTLTLSQPLFGAASNQSYTFSRFKYALDFSGFSGLDKFVLDDIEFQCNGISSGILLAPEGLIFHVRDCFITKPKDRGITSHGRGCQGMLVDRCQFISNEQPMRAQDRTTIAMNVNANDTKMRDNRVMLFAAFGVWAGTGHLFSGNHWFHGDGETDGVRRAGVIFTTPNPKSTVVGNYIDNNFIEMTNEHDATPDWNNQYSFGGITITGNIFTVNDVAPWFSWIVVKPYGSGHYLHGFNLSGNVFRALNGNIERIERVDETYAGLDMSKSRNVVVQGNAFNSVDTPIFNPLMVRHTEAANATTWEIPTDGKLPFGGRARRVEGFVMDQQVLRGSNTAHYEFPYVSLQQGADQSEAHLKWSQACRGRVQITLRMDNAT